MAIKSAYKQQESKSPMFNKPASGNPSPFEATGAGFFNKGKNFAAGKHNANASLTNRATSQSNDKLFKIWLFVNAVQTGWKLAGETAQGQLGRIFYPRNLSQDQFTIEGTVASQFEFDTLARFVESHHQSQIVPQGLIAQSLDGNSYPSLDFMLFKPANSTTFDGFAPLFYSVVIEEFAAGHERFIHAPDYVLTCKVVYDYLAPRYTIQQKIQDRTTIKQVYGDVTSPTPSTNSGYSQSSGSGLH